MTRKSRVQSVKNEGCVKGNLAVHPGYCEICETDFLDIQLHLVSACHIKFVQDNSNYRDLDTLIKEGPSVEDFIKAIGPM